MTLTARTTRRVALRDRRWIDDEALRVLGPLDTITAARLRDALVRLHAAAPRMPVVCRLDRAAGRWVELTPEAFSRGVHEIVLDLDQHGVTDGAEVVRQLIEAPLHDRAALLAVGGGFAGMKMSHALGDGRILNTVLGELLRAAATGGAPQIDTASVRMPLARAAIAYYGRDPRRLASIVNTPRPVMPAGPADGPMRPWRPSWVHSAARSDSATARRLRDWRDRWAPGASAASVLFAAAFSAFQDCGIGAVRPGLMVLVDARRYLPTSKPLHGNFVAAQYLLPADPGNPQTIQTALEQAIRSGRPLTTLALRNLYSLLGRDGETRATQVSVQPRPQLFLSHLGRLSAFADLPWSAGSDERRFLSALRPSDPENISVSIAEMDGAVHVTANFHDTTFEPASVGQALSLLCDDPASLLSQPALR